MLPRSLLILGVVAVVAAVDSDVVTVPKDLMRFILGCQSVGSFREDQVPVYKVDIDEQTGTTSQKFGLLKMDDLGHALRQTVDSEVVVQQIMSQVRDAISASASSGLNQGKECSVQNKINISIPAQEINEFGDKMQQVSHQNNFHLLEQIDNLIDFKLRQHKDGTEKMIKRKLKQVNDKLDIILQALGKEELPEEKDDDVTESSDDDDGVEDELNPDCKCKDKTQTDVTEEVGNEPQAALGSIEVTTITPDEEIVDGTTEPEPEEQQTTVAEPAIVEPQTEPNIVAQTPAPTARPIVITTIKDLDSSSSEEDVSSRNDDDSSSSSSSAEPVGFERVAQQNIKSYSNVGFLRPMMRRPSVSVAGPLLGSHIREKVPII